MGFQDGPYAAISPDLAYLRGRRVWVSYGASTVRVTIVDCDCQATRGIDLFAWAFSQLAPLGAGRIPVTLSWGP